MVTRYQLAIGWGPFGLDIVKAGSDQPVTPDDVIQLDNVVVTAKRPGKRIAGTTYFVGQQVMNPQNGIPFLNSLWGYRDFKGLQVDKFGELTGSHTPIMMEAPDFGGPGKIRKDYGLFRLLKSGLQGKSLKWIIKNKPKGWRTIAKNNGKGWKWIDENGKERLLFERGSGTNSASNKWSCQSNGYFRWRNESGDYLDSAGKVIPRNDPNQGIEFPAYQCIWPDKERLFPWDQNYQLQNAQDVLWRISSQ